MTEQQWTTLVKTIKGEKISPLPVGFIIDSPWLPNWYGIKIIDYFTNDELWLKANFKAIETFKNVMFLPGFWSEYGMCTEPSAFGAKCIFYENEFPFAEKIIYDENDIDKIKKPDPQKDGLLPFMLNRLKLAEKTIKKEGHQIKFSVSRGPLNIASFLMGTTEFLTGIMMYPDKIHNLLRIITDFLIEWHELQRKTFPTIDGMLILDDIVGFIGTEEFKEFALPYLKELYNANVTVKFFHNDAECEASVSFYPEIGINFYNPGIYTSINKIKELTNNNLAILGSVPPRDVLASATPEEVKTHTINMLKELNTTEKLIVSCAGGMPPGVKTENINALIQAVYENKF